MGRGASTTKDRTSNQSTGACAGAMIALATLLRLWNVANPVTLNLHMIRQMIGAMQARNIALGVTDWLHPSLDVAWFPWNPPWFVSLEFPIVPWITAALYRIFGVHTWFGNVLSIGFSAGAAYVFFLIARRLLDSDVAALSALVAFLFLPEAYKYSRLIQPDPLSILLLMTLIYSALRWVDAEETEALGRRRWYAVVVASLMLMLLNKVNYAPLALVALAVVVVGLGWRRLLRLDVILGVVVAVIPAGVWYVWVSGASEFDQFGVLASESMLMKLLTNWHDPAFWNAMADGFNGWLLLPGIAVALVGLFLVWRDRRERDARVLLTWVAATFLYLYVVGPDLLAPHRYYFLPLLPIACLLIGLVVGRATTRLSPSASNRAGLVGAAVLGSALVLAAGSWWMLRGYYAETEPEMRTYLSAAETVRTNTDPDDLVVFETEDWGVTLFISYSSGRSGWTRLGEDKLAEAVDRGASYAFVSSAPYPEKYFSSAEEAEVLAERRRAVEARAERVVARTDAGDLFSLSAAER